MPLETATYTADLVTSNPAHSDPLSNADAHMRLIKATLKATFANFTSAPLNSTQAQIDAAVSATANGISVLADAGVNFKTNSTDGLRNPSAGSVAVTSGGTTVATFAAAGLTLPGNITVTGAITATGAITGPGCMPIGSLIMWPSDTLPPSTEGVWAWANGQAVSRTTYATAFARLGTTWGAGDGSTTWNVPNGQEVSWVGKSTMGGASSPGLLTSIATGVKQVLNGLMGSDTVTLVAANLPPHNHSVFLKDPGHTHAGGQASGQNGFAGSNPSSVWFGGAGSTSSATTGLTVGSVSGVANDNQTAAGPGTSTAVANIQPSRFINFIIRLA